MFLFGGFIPLVLVNNLKKRRAELKHWQKTEAVVYDILYDSSGVERPHTIAYPKYRFSRGGGEYSGTISHGITPGKYKAGDGIEILYNPSNPSESDAPERVTIGPFTLPFYDLVVIVYSTMSALCFAVGIVSAILFLFRKGI